MDFKALVEKRRSIRQYRDQPIPEPDLLKCIEAARLAPSACNSQPWKFIIINQKPVIKKAVQNACHTIYGFNKFIASAAALILVIPQKKSFLLKTAGKMRGIDYCLIDIGIACQQLVLQAESLGIGSCWIGWFDQKRLKKSLALAEKGKIEIIIALGYPAKETDKPQVRKPREEIAFFYPTSKTEEFTP